MLGIGLAIGVFVGALLGVAIFRYALGLGEKLVYGARDGTPALSDYAQPLEYDTTGETETE